MEQSKRKEKEERAAVRKFTDRTLAAGERVDALTAESTPEENSGAPVLGIGTPECDQRIRNDLIIREPRRPRRHNIRGA